MKRPADETKLRDLKEDARQLKKKILVYHANCTDAKVIRGEIGQEEYDEDCKSRTEDWDEWLDELIEKLELLKP